LGGRGREMESTTLDVLTIDECQWLLRENVGSVGRIGVSVGAVPEVLPVNFAMSGGDIVFRTSRGTKLHAAATNAVVAFEVDGSDEVSGWSVLVVGQASEVTDPADIAAALAVIPDGWAPGEHEHVVRLEATRVTGRRIRRIQNQSGTPDVHVVR
jgi:uncharacterized protein